MKLGLRSLGMMPSWPLAGSIDPGRIPRRPVEPAFTAGSRLLSVGAISHPSREALPLLALRRSSYALSPGVRPLREAPTVRGLLPHRVQHLRSGSRRNLVWWIKGRPDPDSGRRA